MYDGITQWGYNEEQYKDFRCVDFDFDSDFKLNFILTLNSMSDAYLTLE